jgi:hypothetical protein
MKSKTLIFLTAGLFYTNLLFAQHEGAEGKHEAETRNEISLFLGNTIISQSGFNLPTIGVEYIRELNHFIGIGVISELEIGSHVIQKDEAGDVIGDVKREGAFLILPTAFIKVYKGLIFYGGYGVEFERNENIGLMKLGFEYKLALKNPKWLVLPNLSWDRTHLFDGFVYGVSFGYRF